MTDQLRDVLLASGSGFVGQALTQHLTKGEHKVAILIRRATSGIYPHYQWNQATGQIAPRAVEWADAIINLTGERITDGAWTPTRKAELLQSHSEHALRDEHWQRALNAVVPNPVPNHVLVKTLAQALGRRLATPTTAVAAGRKKRVSISLPSAQCSESHTVGLLVSLSDDSGSHLFIPSTHYTIMTDASRSLLRLTNVSKAFTRPDGTPFMALNRVSLDVPAGQRVAIIGKSGSGKSTLLNLLTGIDQATDGTVLIGGQLLGQLSENELARWRGKHVGIVFQFFQLMPTLTVLENIVFAMDLVGIVPTGQREDKARNLLDRVGLADQADKLPQTLSGGQQQRVAIARALANDPPLLVADEPTGNLDSQTTESILALFESINAQGVTLLIVTHDEDVARRAHRTIRLRDGQLVDDTLTTPAS
nr:ATP-binding cassette domain-containing protein [Spirosoma montaniterrae]